MFLFLGTFNLPNLLSESRTMALGEGDRVFVVRAARKLLQVLISRTLSYMHVESTVFSESLTLFFVKGISGYFFLIYKTTSC